MGQIEIGVLSQSFGVIGDDFDAQLAPHAMRSQYSPDQ
jgi:hypothetical protein